MSGMRGPKILRLPPNIILAVRLRQEEIQDQRLYSVCKILCLLVAITILSNRLCSSGIMQAVTYIYWHLFQISN